MIYAGDLVEEKSRTVKLLARAENPDRLLKPGMFVEVEVLSPRPSRPIAGPGLGAADPGEPHVRLRAERPRPVRPPRGRGRAPRDEATVAIRSGLEPGEEVVVEGGFKLKAARPSS